MKAMQANVQLRPVSGYEGRYAITKSGKVWSYPKASRNTGGWLNPSINAYGYQFVVLYSNGGKKTHYVRMLVANEWLRKIPGKPHLKTITRNFSDSSVSNLEWSDIPAIIRAAHASAKANRTHGLSDTRAFIRWGGMIDRCRNPKATSWSNYGAKGITVCKRWMTFQNFFDDMGHPPPGLSIERKNSKKNYSPENCVWATSKQQAQNRKTTRWLKLNGVTKCMTDWAEILGISVQALWRRIEILGWPLQVALTTRRSR